MNKFIMNNEKLLRYIGLLFVFIVYLGAFICTFVAIMNTSSIPLFIFYAILLFAITMFVLFSSRDLLKIVYDSAGRKRFYTFIGNLNMYLCFILFFATFIIPYYVAKYSNAYEIVGIYFLCVVIYTVVSNLVIKKLKEKK